MSPSRGVRKADLPLDGNDPETRNETIYLDIVPDRRIVMAYTMAIDGANISAFMRFTARETPRRICSSGLPT